MVIQKERDDRDFNPPSPCGEGLAHRDISVPRFIEFQSTLPVWGGTLEIVILLYLSGLFQSTLPVWGGTPCGEGPFVIHLNRFAVAPCGEGPRVGRDHVLGVVQDFYIRAVWGGTPCGEGRQKLTKILCKLLR